MKQYLTWPPSRRYLSSCSPPSWPRVLPCLVLVIVYQPARQNAPSGIGWAICCQTWSIKVCQVLSVLNCYFDGLPHAHHTLLLLLIVLLTTGLPQPASSLEAAVYGVSQEINFYFRKNWRSRNQLLTNKNFQRNVITKMFRIASKKALHDLKFESNKCEFFMRVKGEIFA